MLFRSDESKYKFWKGDYVKISQELQDVNWDLELNVEDVNEAWQRLRIKINDLVDKYVARQSTIARKPRKSEWMSKPTQKEMKVRGMRWEVYRRNPTEANYGSLKKISYKVNSMVKEDKDAYRQTILKSFKKKNEEVLWIHEEFTDSQI